MIKDYLLDELDKILALIGVIFSLILTIWIKLMIGHTIYVMVGILCFLACAGYLIIRRFLHPSFIHYLEELKGSTRFYITLNILFFLLLSYSIISIYLRPNPYIRPLEYFISIALMAVFISYEILFLSPQKPRIYFTLCKIIIIGLTLEYSQILIFPNVVGADPWWHQWFTFNLLDNGYIPDGLPYSKMPLMHLMIGMTSLVTDLGYKLATMFSISSLQVICDALFIFLLGKFLISTKVGLLAALLLELSNYHIHFGFWTIPNTMAATLILPIVFIIFKIRRDKPFIGNLVVMFLMGTLILTHTVTAIFLSMLLFGLWAGSETYAKLFHEEKTHQSVTFNISVLFSIGMLAYWTYASGHIMNLSYFIKWGFRTDLLERSFSYISEIPLWEHIFNDFGMFLLFSLSFIGCLYMTSKQFRNRNRFSIILAYIGILCITFFSIILEKKIAVGRWYYFSQILLVIPLSLSLFLLNGIFKNHFIKGFLMSILVFTLSFILIMSSAANIDNRLFSPNIGIRFAFTKSELHSMNTISRIWNGTIGSDAFTHVLYDYQLDLEFTYIDDFIYSGNFTDMKGFPVLIREEILKNRFYTKSGGIKLKYDLPFVLETQKFSNIYDCGSVNGYLKP